MNRMKSILILAVLVSGLAATAARAQLKIGDPAPVLTVSDWVKGKAVDIRKNPDGKMFLIEFWATWCGPCYMSMPHLSELQKKYEKQLVVIGATSRDDRGNTLEQVKTVVERQGDKMAYTVAFDRSGKLQQDYLDAVRAEGIPYAFLVGKGGELLWHGNPMDPEMDAVVEQAVAGKYDVEKAKVQDEIRRRMSTLNFLYNSGQLDQVRAGLLEVLKLDPANPGIIEALYRVDVFDRNDAAGARAWVEAHLADFIKKPEVMEAITYVLCDVPDLTRRQPDLALKAGKAAFDSEGRTSRMARLYALALYQVGNLEKAVEVQKKAVEIASTEEREFAEKMLAFYEKCRTLQTSDGG